MRLPRYPRRERIITGVIGAAGKAQCFAFAWRGWMTLEQRSAWIVGPFCVRPSCRGPCLIRMSVYSSRCFFLRQELGNTTRSALLLELGLSILPFFLFCI